MNSTLFQPRTTKCKGDGAFSGIPQIKPKCPRPNPTNTPAFIIMKGSQHEMWVLSRVHYSKAMWHTPKARDRDKVCQGPQRPGLPRSFPEPHLELSGHGYNFVVRRVVLVAIGEHQPDICTKFLSITVLTGLQFRLERQDRLCLPLLAEGDNREGC